MMFGVPTTDKVKHLVLVSGKVYASGPRSIDGIRVPSPTTRILELLDEISQLQKELTDFSSHEKVTE